MKNCGNFTGRMTASLSESFAPSSPATSSHCRGNFSVRQAKPRLAQTLTTLALQIVLHTDQVEGLKRHSMQAPTPSHLAARP